MTKGIHNLSTAGRVGLGRACLVAGVIAAVCSACGSPPHQATPGSVPPSAAAAPVRVAHTSEGTVSYRSVGAGPPLVMIVGYSFSMDEWPPVFVDTLAARYRVITFDNAGIGQTSPLPAPLTISAMADQTDALIQALHLGQTNVLGWSMGGMIAQALAVLHPGDLDRLVLCATLPGNGYATTGNPAASNALLHPNVAQGIEELLFPPDQQARQIPAYALQISQYPSFDRAPLALDRQQLTASTAWAKGRDPAGAGTDHITAPTLIGDGEDDVLVPTANNYVLHEDLRRSQLVLYPDAGHGFLFQDVRPWTEKVESFLGQGRLA